MKRGEIYYADLRPVVGSEQGGIRPVLIIQNDVGNKYSPMLAEGLFAEYEEYSQGRFYGTLKSDYVEGNNVAVLTPNGIRQLKRNLPNADIYSVLVEANLGTRMLRYINRVGLDKFNFDDKNEICNRTERDWSMFLGMDKEVNLVVDNNYNRNIKDVVSDILNA